MLFEPREVSTLFVRLGISHVVWLPDSTMGSWEGELLAESRMQLLRVCREGEAWPLAAGLYLGGQRPLVLMQSTGFFESGDALRNILFDLKIPLFSVVGARNWLNPHSHDSARRFLAAIVAAWQINVQWIVSPDEKDRLASCYEQSQRARQPAVVLLAEGKG